MLAAYNLNSHSVSAPIAKLKRRKNRRWNLDDPLRKTSMVALISYPSGLRSLHSLSFRYKSKSPVCEPGLFNYCPKLSLSRVFRGRVSTCELTLGSASASDRQSELEEEILEGTSDFSKAAQRMKFGCADPIALSNREKVVSHEMGKGIGENQTESSQLKNGENKRVDVRALAGNLRLAKTAEDVEEVLKDYKELPLPVYSSVIRGFGIEKKLEPAFALVDWLKGRKGDSEDSLGPNLFIYNSLLGAIKQAEQFGLVHKVMEDMGTQNIIPNIVTYNTLMAIYVEQGEPKRALNVFAEIQERGLEPSSASYSTVLLAYRRMEDGEGALRLLIEIRQKYLKGDRGQCLEEDWETELAKLENFTLRICYQVMRRWLVKGDHLTTNVLKLLNDMDKEGLKAGRSDYEKLVWACTLEGHYTVVRELYKRIREREGEISLSACNHIIWLMGKAKKWWAALEVYEELSDKGPKPNNLSHELVISHFNVLLTAAKKRGIWRWGVRLLNKMQQKGLKPGSQEWNAVLVACSKASETSAAVQIFRRMVEQGEKPTVVSYGALLSALEKGQMYDEALRVWKHMQKVGVEPNLYAYTILVSIYIGLEQQEKVDWILRKMVSCGVEPTVVTFNAIITGCAKKGMGSAAFEWFHRMKVQNITPNQITYEMLIEGLARDGKPRLAYEMYLRAGNEGLKLSCKAYDAVMVSARHYGASIDLSALGPRPPEPKKKMKTRKILSEFCDLADVPRHSEPFDAKEVYSP